MNEPIDPSQTPRRPHETTLAVALVAALAELTVVDKAHRADAGSYSYQYADLADIVKLTRPVLAAHGVVVLQSIEERGTGLAISTELLHSSGDVRHYGPLPFPFGKDAQATGSAITYHRRYALLAALGMATGEDDDGARAVPAPVDDYTPGLRTSVEAAIGKLDDDGREALKGWMAAEDLPAVRRMNGDQLARTIDHLMADE